MTNICHICHFQNPPGMRFCGRCGTRLREGPDTSPAYELDITREETQVTLIGPYLLDRMRQATVQVAGQNRNVTLMAIEMTGISDQTTNIPNQDTQELLQQCLRIFANDIYKYEGTIHSFKSNGLIAIFGAPITHENNAELAVRAALDMQADLKWYLHTIKSILVTEPQIHIGLHSGCVAIESVPKDLPWKFSGVEDTLSLAENLQEAAPLGTVLVSEPVFQQTQLIFDYLEVPLSTCRTKPPSTAFKCAACTTSMGQCAVSRVCTPP